MMWGIKHARCNVCRLTFHLQDMYDVTVVRDGFITDALRNSRYCFCQECFDMGKFLEENSDKPFVIKKG